MPPIQWSSAYHAAWDATPEEYVASGAVGWGRSRRLGKYLDDALGLKAYLGVQHYDPGRWGVEGAAQAKFFLSLFVGGRTVTLRTFPTLDDAITVLEAFRADNSRSKE